MNTYQVTVIPNENASSQVITKGKPYGLNSYVEKRLARIGQFLYNPTVILQKTTLGKAFDVPRSKSIERLRNRFGKKQS